MKTLFFALIFIETALFVHAQNDRKVVFWSGDKNCGYKSVAFSVNDAVVCGTISTDRGPVSTISINGIGLAVAFLEESDFNLLAASITNRTRDVLMFDSDQWGAAHFKTRASFFAKEKPILAETSMPSRDIIRSMSSATKLDTSLDTFIADGQKTTEVREIRRSDGTVIRKAVIVPDKDAQEAAVRKGENMLKNMTNEQQKIRRDALTAKSVLPDSSVKGLVYFRRVKNAEFLMFSITRQR